MHITIISDTNDENAMGRVRSRVGTYTDASVDSIGVGSFADLQAAGNLVDILDAQDGMSGAIIVNVAPRHGKAKKWKNGTPFCFFKHEQTSVIATVDGYTLSLIKKLNIVDSVQVMDMHSALKQMGREGLLSSELVEYVARSQFRSFDFAPRVLVYLLEGYELPSVKLPMSDVLEAPKAPWWIDNFGNVKTTLLPHEIGFEIGKKIQLTKGEFTCYERLADVPDHESAIVIGSSGIEDKRFIEITVQGARASDKYGIKIGDELIPEPTPESEAQQSQA